MPWTPADLPDLTGRTFLITGANSGIGKEAARELARKGGRILMACRSLDKANEAMADLRADVPGADLTFVQLDLARLTSVRVAADAIGALGGCDVLINNAGIMAIPRTLTADGFEMQIGTNHLGHFALTGLLLPDLEGVDSVEQQLAIARRKAGVPPGAAVALERFRVRKEAPP